MLRFLTTESHSVAGQITHPHGVCYLCISLSTKFPKGDKRSNMPYGDKHVTVPCGRLSSVTKFPKGDKRPNMPCGDKHVTVPCVRLRSVTKFPKGGKSLTCPAGIHRLRFLTTESHSVAGHNNIPRQGEQIGYKFYLCICSLYSHHNLSACTYSL